MSRGDDPKRPPGIRFDDVTVAYHGNVVLDSFDLAVEPGEVMALLGPSGSGKTTALRSVAGFVQPVRGRVFLGDRDVTRVAPCDRGVGMVVQQYALFPHMNVSQNVAFGLKARKAKKSKIRDQVGESLRMVGMESFADRYPRELSGGQQQRVAIARALAIQPKVLLLDEPLSALDAQLRSGMLAEIARLHRELPDVTILYVTHDQIEALTLADRIAVMDQAKLIEVGTSRDLYDQPGREFTASFLGNANLLTVEVVELDQTSGMARVRHGAEHFTVRTVGVTEGDETVLCIRPHRLSLNSTSAEDNQVTGTVAEVQWRGESHRLYVDIAGAQVRIDAPNLRRPPAIGESISLYFEPQDSVLVPGGVG